MSLFTIWALFSDDIRIAASTKEADFGFMIVISIAFLLFALELIAGSLYKENYLCLPSFVQTAPHETWLQKAQRLCQFGSFYFWLDLIATVSLIFEINWIIGDSLETTNQTSLKSARAGRASRAGARAGRIVRLVRMVKLYKYYSDNTVATSEGDVEMSSHRRHPSSPHHRATATAEKKKENEHIAVNVSTSSDPHAASHPLPLPPLQGIKEENESRIESQFSNPSFQHPVSSSSRRLTRGSVSDLLGEEEESKVGAAMSDITTKRVIVLVLVMLICIPLMTYSPTDISPSFGTSLFHQVMKASLTSSNTTDQVRRLLSSPMPRPPSFTLPIFLQTGIDLTVSLLETDFEHIVSLKSNDVFYLHHKGELDSLRTSEIAVYEFSSRITLATGTMMRLTTIGQFSIRDEAITEALYSIYLTIFILLLLVVRPHFIPPSRLVPSPTSPLLSLRWAPTTSPLT
jgi:hypothetical protein